MTIRSEIESRLATWANLQNPKIPVSYENVSFVKPKTGQYLEVFLLDSISINPEISASDTRVIGTFQVNCYSPLGCGMASVEALAQNIIDLYPVLPKTGTVSIEAPLDAASGMIVEGYMCVPVSGRYRSEI